LRGPPPPPRRARRAAPGSLGAGEVEAEQIAAVVGHRFILTLVALALASSYAAE